MINDRGQEIVFQYGHNAVTGNQAADHVSIIAHASIQHLDIPIVAAERNSIVRAAIGKLSSLTLGPLSLLLQPSTPVCTKPIA